MNRSLYPHVAFFAASLILAACQGYFPPRHFDGGPDPCEGVTCSNHGACVNDGGNATCRCETGYTDEGLTCVPADPCTQNIGWGAACDGRTCDDGSFCSSMFAESDLGMCFLPCVDHSDCTDICDGEELCGASNGDDTYCYIVCERDAECPCDMLCLEVADADYRVCGPE